MGTKVNIFIVTCLLYGMMVNNFTMCMLFLILTGFTALYKNFKVWQFTLQLPGAGFPRIADFGASNSVAFHRRLHHLWMKHGKDKFVTWIGGERYVVVSHKKDVQKVMDPTDDGALMKQQNHFWPWLGGDVIKGCNFKTSAIISACLDGIFYQNSKEIDLMLTRQIQRLCKKNVQQVGNSSAVNVVREWTFDAVYALATGQEIAERREIFEACEKLCSLADSRVFSIWRQSSLLLLLSGDDAKLRQLRNILSKNICEALKSSSNGTSLMDALQEDESLSDEQRIATLTGFIVLGFDRMSTTINCALMELARCPEGAKLIRSDVTAIDRLLMETMRVHPAVPVITRWNTHCIPLSGFFVPPDTSIMIYLQGTKYEPEVAFKMTRRMETDADGTDTLPMMVMRIIIKQLMDNFNLKMDNDDVTMGSGITLRPSGLRLKIAAR